MALGGASWPKLGSDGGWAEILKARGVEVTPLAPANCGFTIAWNEIFRARFAGQPLKNVSLHAGGHSVRGECLITQYGIEGGAVYALAPILREAIARNGSAELCIDLRPDATLEHLAKKLERPKRAQSMANVLRKAASLSPLEINLMQIGRAHV